MGALVPSATTIVQDWLNGSLGGGGGRAKRKDRSFHSSFIAGPRYTAKQNSPLMRARHRLSVTRRLLRTNRGIRHKSIISIRVYSGVPGPRAVNGATKTTKHSYGISN